MLNGYHACPTILADLICSNKAKLAPGQGDSDWLGEGVYFWHEEIDHAREWVLKKQQNPINSAVSWSIIHAKIKKGNCLDLRKKSAQEEMKQAHDFLVSNKVFSSNYSLVSNKKYKDGISIERKRDHAVMMQIHTLRNAFAKRKYDTIIGVFHDGKPIFPGAGILSKSHIQICVRSHLTHIKNPKIIERDI